MVNQDTQSFLVFFYVVFLFIWNFFYPEKNHHINEKKNFIYNQSINDGHLSNVGYFEIWFENVENDDDYDDDSQSRIDDIYLLTLLTLLTNWIDHVFSVFVLLFFVSFAHFDNRSLNLVTECICFFSLFSIIVIIDFLLFFSFFFLQR